jgi:hypothetical protein
MYLALDGLLGGQQHLRAIEWRDKLDSLLGDLTENRPSSTFE